MTSTHRRDGDDRSSVRSLAVAFILTTALMTGGCAPINSMTAKILRGQPVAAVAVSTPVADQPAAHHHAQDASSASASLETIIDHDLQHGRYVAGRRALLRYLKRHPDDRRARSMLHQLTANPQRVLGKHWRPHVVQPGDSYSALAARYLGDPDRFLILARYNGSRDPSVLQLGQTLHLPTSAAYATHVEIKPVPSSTPHAAASTGPQSVKERARRMQEDSLALLDQGHKARAMARLGQALTLDPKLPPSNSRARALRQRLLSSYHERAIVLYRDQKLDQAIALWNRILAIDPGYEPAVVYRTRALELKRRLQQL